jgi:hypothetical protein
MSMLWNTSRKRVQLLLFVIGVMVIAIIVAYAQASPVELEADVPGVGTLGSQFMIAVPITNEGTANAMNVQVTGTTLGTAPRISPPTFPVVVGTIPPGGTSDFQADFDAAGLAPNTLYVLTIIGTYQVNEVTFSFRLTRQVSLPPASPGFGTTNTVMVPFERLSGPPSPHLEPGFGPGINEPGPPTPIAPFVAGTQSPPISIQPLQVANAALGGAKPAAGPKSDPAVAINTNEGFGILPTGGGGGEPREPSGASGDGMVFVSFNWGAAYSTGGGVFTLIDPSTMINSTDPYKFCCDQHVQFVPGIGFIWLQQLNYNGNCCGPGGYRLAVASAADIIKYGGQKEAWTVAKFTDASFKLAPGTEFDFPSMSVGNNFLYISWDNNCALPTKPVTYVPGCIAGRQVVRIRLSHIKAGANPLPVTYTTDASKSGGCAPTDTPNGDCWAWASFLTQDTGDEVFWAGHNLNNQLRIFSWAEDSSIYHWRDRRIDSYVQNPDGGNKGHIASLAPSPVLSEGGTPQDWLYRNADDDIVGATRSGSNIFFAWNAAPPPNGNIPNPNIEIVAFDVPTGYVKVQQGQIYSAAFATGLPSLSTDACTKEIGVSMAYGGGGNYPNHAVGFWGDSTFYPTTAGNVTGNEYGDFVTIRQNNTPALKGAFFDAFGYALTNASGGPLSTLPPDQVNASIRHVVFGRPGACGQ